MLTDSSLQVFGITVPLYGVIVCLAVFLAALLADIAARRCGLDPLHVWRALVPITILALIGARLWFVLFPPQSVVANGRTADWLLRNFFDLNQGAVAVWTGGLGGIGGIVGGGIGLWWYCRINQQVFTRWLDIAALSLPFGQAVGRLANGVTQELYGAPTSSDWGMLITQEAQRVFPFTDLIQYPLDSTKFHPVFAYEAICSALIFFALLVATRRVQKLQSGDVALLYIILYGTARFFLELLRVNVSLLGGINISQTVALLAAVVAGIILFRRPRLESSQQITDS